MKKISVPKIIAVIILTIILVFNLIVIYSEKDSNTGILTDMPFALLPVAGSSMEPKLKSGDAILVVNTPFYQLKVGDIIVYARGGELITHEIIARTRESLTCKGTNNEYQDSEVGLDEYKAKVVTKIPLMGSLWRIGSSPIRFAIFAVLMILIIFGKDLFNAIFNKLFKDTAEK